MKPGDHLGVNNERREKLLWRLSVLSLVVIVAAVLGLFVWGLYSIDVLVLPSFISDLFPKGEDAEDEVIPGDEGAIMQAVKDHAEGVEVTVIPDPDTLDLASLLFDLPEHPTYTLVNYTILKSDDSFMMRMNKVWRDGEKYRVETYSADGAQRLVTAICDGETVSITDHLYDTTARYPAGGEFTLSSQAGMPDIELTRGEGAPELEVSLVRSANDNLYYCVFDYEQPEQREELYISIEYGIVVRAETYVGENVVYTLETESLDVVSAIPASRFIVKNES
ncbi:MAG: hypothetical protein IJA85_03875 [Clostridia bacterium]|nr:hypothetical protein [Clostridia bacterium]